MVRFLLIGLTAALCAIGAARALDQFGDVQPPHAVAVASADQSQPTDPAPQPDGQASIAKSSDGHFWADAVVDGRPVRFLVDTGATAVALTAADARSLGIDPDALTYSYTVTTANGQAHAAAVRLDDVAVGRAEVDNVQAFVIDKGLQTSLLGMSYLGRLSKFEATQNALVLKS